MQHWKQIKLVAAMLLASSTLSACQAQSQDDSFADRPDIAKVADDDKEMNAAKAEAQTTLPTFLAILDKPASNTDMIGFKYPLGGNEHIWVDNVKRDGNFLTGNLANVPMLEGHTQGEAVRVPLKDVSDWAARVDGKMQGHYTTRVLLPQLDPQEAAAIKEQFGWE